jgi:hypothetical protein
MTRLKLNTARSNGKIWQEHSGFFAPLFLSLSLSLSFSFLPVVRENGVGHGINANTIPNLQRDHCDDYM